MNISRLVCKIGITSVIGKSIQMIELDNNIFIVDNEQILKFIVVQNLFQESEDIYFYITLIANDKPHTAALFQHRACYGQGQYD